MPTIYHSQNEMVTTRKDKEEQFSCLEKYKKNFSYFDKFMVFGNLLSLKDAKS
jgi:hypothetical protein